MIILALPGALAMLKAFLVIFALRAVYSLKGRTPSNYPRRPKASRITKAAGISNEYFRFAEGIGYDEGVQEIILFRKNSIFAFGHAACGLCFRKGRPIGI